MNRRTEKTVITIKTFQRTTIRLRRKATIAWCESCAAETMILEPDEAAAHLQITTREICRLTEDGEIHFIETRGGTMLVCAQSIRRYS